MGWGGVVWCGVVLCGAVRCGVRFAVEITSLSSRSAGVRLEVGLCKLNWHESNKCCSGAVPISVPQFVC